MIFWLLDNAFSTFGNKIYRQTTGIPTGTNAAPELTQLYLLYYELSFFCRSLSKGWSNLPADLQTLILTYLRYIDDIYHVPGGFAVGAEPVRCPGEAPREGVSSKNGWGWVKCTKIDAPRNASEDVRASICF